MKTIVVVPSRLGSTRLANKALADINGKTMIARVLEICKKTCLANGFDLLLATDNNLIAQQAQALNVDFAMTQSDIKTGSDRIYNALEQKNLLNKYDVVINMQGDVPNIDSSIITNAAKVLSLEPSADISTAFYRIDKQKASEPSVVKPILCFNNNQRNAAGLELAKALYFTRALAPYNAEQYFEHIGIYAYRMDALQKFVSLGQGELEKCESLEQLRALENNMQIYGFVTSHKPISVDTEADLTFARQFII